MHCEVEHIFDQINARMGKKSRKPSSKQTPLPLEASASAEKLTYPSDGPSEEELACLQTSSTSLQAKLDQLTSFALANDRAAFVSAFVPLDISAADTAAYLQDLTTAPEAESQWANLSAEIVALAAGKNVHRIEGNQKCDAAFFFAHPLLPGCDREVSFVCVNGEWRAEG